MTVKNYEVMQLGREGGDIRIDEKDVDWNTLNKQKVQNRESLQKQESINKDKIVLQNRAANPTNTTKKSSKRQEKR